MMDYTCGVCVSRLYRLYHILQRLVDVVVEYGIHYTSIRVCVFLLFNYIVGYVCDIS